MNITKFCLSNFFKITVNKGLQSFKHIYSPLLDKQTKANIFEMNIFCKNSQMEIIMGKGIKPISVDKLVDGMSYFHSGIFFFRIH